MVTFDWEDGESPTAFAWRHAQSRTSHKQTSILELWKDLGPIVQAIAPPWADCDTEWLLGQLGEASQPDAIRPLQSELERLGSDRLFGSLRTLAPVEEQWMSLLHSSYRPPVYRPPVPIVALSHGRGALDRLRVPLLPRHTRDLIDPRDLVEEPLLTELARTAHESVIRVTGCRSIWGPSGRLTARVIAGFVGALVPAASPGADLWAGLVREADRAPSGARADRAFDRDAVSRAVEAWASDSRWPLPLGQEGRDLLARAYSVDFQMAGWLNEAFDDTYDLAGPESELRYDVAVEIGLEPGSWGKPMRKALVARDGSRTDLWGVPHWALENAVVATMPGLDPAIRERLAKPWRTYERWIGIWRRRGPDWYRQP